MPLHDGPTDVEAQSDAHARIPVPLSARPLVEQHPHHGPKNMRRLSEYSDRASKAAHHQADHGRVDEGCTRRAQQLVVLARLSTHGTRAGATIWYSAPGIPEQSQKYRAETARMEPPG